LYVIKNIHTLCVIWGHTILLLLVFHKFVEPDGHFTFKIASDVREGFAGSN
jgi:hypothetical protein